jgi:hypothetical protein
MAEVKNQDVRLCFSNAEMKIIENKAKQAGLTKKAYIESAALNTHIAPKADDSLVVSLRALYDLGSTLNSIDATIEQKSDTVKDLRKLIHNIEKEYFSNY